MSEKAKSDESISINNILIEYNVHMQSHELYVLYLVIAYVLFVSELCIEYLIVLQWLNHQYYIIVIALFIFSVLSNVSNLFQWYFSFTRYSTFKLYHFIIPLGLIGLLPFLSVIYCLCARINNKYHQRQQCHNDASESLLAPRSSSRIDIHHELLNNITQLLISQSFIRILPFICITLFVWISVELQPTSWLLTGFNDTDFVHMPHELDSLLIESHSLSAYYVIAIFVSLFTYAFITVTYWDIIPQESPHSLWFYKCVQLLQMTFVIFDCILRTVPLIFALYCASFSAVAIVLGFEVMWCFEVCFWYEIYEYFPWFPMRKIYPMTYGQMYNDPISSSPSNVITDTKSRVSCDSHSQKQYQNPQYMSNATILSPVSVEFGTSEDGLSNKEEATQKVWVPDSILQPTWTIVWEEYIALAHGLLGGTLSCVSGWIIGRSAKHCVDVRQYKMCIIELFGRYMLSIIVMVIYAHESGVDFNYWIWPLCIGSLVGVIPYIVLVHFVFNT